MSEHHTPENNQEENREYTTKENTNHLFTTFITLGSILLVSYGCGNIFRAAGTNEQHLQVLSSGKHKSYSSEEFTTPERDFSHYAEVRDNKTNTNSFLNINKATYNVFQKVQKQPHCIDAKVEWNNIIGQQNVPCIEKF